MTPSVTIQTHSLATSRFFARRGDVEFPATCFFLRRGTEYFLVTALHVLTGRHWQTGSLLSKEGLIPERFTYLFPYYKLVPPTQHQIGWDRIVLEPFGENEEVAPWLVHPILRERADVGIIPLGNTPQKFLEAALAAGKATASEVFAFEWNDVTHLPSSAGDDVQVIGFPENIKHGSEFPIWKRGSIASEPDLPVDGLPYTLVDTGTRSGMSGSPVVRRIPAGIGSHGAPGNFAFFPEPRVELFGVYSGRFGVDELTSQLGIVWKRSVISEILATPTLGKSSLCTRLWL